jgi:hypothetical protein
VSGEREPGATMVPESDDPTADRVPPRRFGVADLVIAIVIGFLFASSVYAAVGNLTGIPSLLLAAGLAESTPWVPLVAAVAAPPVLFVTALLVGLRRTTLQRTLVLIVALAASSALTLSLSAWALSLIPFG